MTEELKMWTVGNGGEATSVKQASHIETENLLEKTLVKNPDMLIPELKLVGDRRRPPEAGSTCWAWTGMAGSSYSN